MTCTLVTGGCGYLGSHLLRAFAQDARFAGTTVRILDNFSTGRYEALLDLPGGVDFQLIEGDLLDPAACRRALDGVDAVVHLAAIHSPPFAFNHPPATVQVNQWGTARLVEHCHEAGVERLVFASSASVYGNGGPFNEADAPRPVGPYAQSKLGAEHAVLAAESLDGTVLRLGMLYGGSAPVIRFDTFPNHFAYLASVGRAISVPGSGAQLRPVLHVEDAARALLFALSHDATSANTYNVAERDVDLSDAAAIVAKLAPDGRVVETDQEYSQQVSLSVDGSRFASAGWRARQTLEVGLSELMDRMRGLRPVRASMSRDELGLDES